MATKKTVPTIRTRKANARKRARRAPATSAQRINRMLRVIGVLRAMGATKIDIGVNLRYVNIEWAPVRDDTLTIKLDEGMKKLLHKTPAERTRKVTKK